MVAAVWMTCLQREFVEVEKVLGKWHAACAGRDLSRNGFARDV